MKKQKKQPGTTKDMSPKPHDKMEGYLASGKLDGKVAIVTGGDSGIGRAVAIAFAKEGAHVVIVYLNEDEDAKETRKYVEREDVQCLLVKGDVGQENFCLNVVEKAYDMFGKIDVVVNNAGEQHPQESILDITEDQLEKTFRTNFFGYFFMAKACVKYLQKGSSIINTSSITAFNGNKSLIDYSATKGAITSFTKSLALSLAEKGIRVNAIAPGPVWTPLIPSTFSKEKVKNFGKETKMKRVGQPDELAPAYVFLAGEDSSFITGQTIHIDGGEN